MTDSLGAVQDTVMYGYDPLGNLALAQDADSTLTFAYDLLGRLITTTSGEAGTPAFAHQVPGTLGYAYDPAGNRTLLSVNAGQPSLAYAYDALSRLTQLALSSPPAAVSKTFEYDAVSRLTRLLGGDRTESVYTYDTASQLLDISHLMRGVEVAPHAYTYDLLGNRTTLTDRVGLHTYGYDTLSRLTSADHPLASGLPDEAFTYDAVGNRTTSFLSTSHVHDAANRLLEDDSFTYTYDANGNLTSKTDKTTLAVTTYTYDVEHQLVGITAPGLTVSYAYDALGRRIQKTVNGQVTRYLYDQEDLWLILNGTTNLGTHLILHGPGIDQPLAFLRDTSGDCNPFVGSGGFREPIVDLLADGLGSQAAVTAEQDAFGITVSLAERYAYESFGKPTITGPGPDGALDTPDDVLLTESALGNPYLFTGREYDPETGLIYVRERYLDPGTGTFLQMDPVVGFTSRPQSLNRYPYVDNNPVNKIDPFGAQPTSVILTSLGIGAGSPPVILSQASTNKPGKKQIREIIFSLLLLLFGGGEEDPRRKRPDPPRGEKPRQEQEFDPKKDPSRPQIGCPF